MRDHITINELNKDLRDKINRIPDNITEIYNKEDIDIKFEEIKELISDNNSSKVDLSNYYTKTETDIKINQTVNASILDHNTNTSSHNDIRTSISDLTTIISKLHIEAQVFPLIVTEDNQRTFSIDDPNYLPVENPTSIVIWNTIVLTNYTVSGRTVTFPDGMPIDSNLTIIIFSLKGAV